MSVRVKNDRWIVELYDSSLGKKRYVTQAEMRALGFEPPTNEHQTRRIERRVLDEQDRASALGADEDVAAFTVRWPDDYRQQRSCLGEQLPVDRAGAASDVQRRGR